MGEGKLLSVIIPAYNEEKTIVQVLDSVFAIQPSLQQNFKHDMEVIVVDDGSRDKTASNVKKYQELHKDVSLKLISKSNGGKGSAFKCGVNEARGNIIICQDADLEYDPSDYIELIKPFVHSKALVVYGSRVLDPRTIDPRNKYTSFLYQMGGKSVTVLTNILYGAKLADEPTGYKLFDSKLLKSIHLEGNSFDWEPEVTAKILRMGISINEVPISYRPRTVEQGKKIRFRDGLIAYWTLLKWRVKPFKSKQHFSRSFLK